ncbi:ArsR family transcriptional regulator [Paracoccus alkenifer]|uniref:ArsR family transcriptional regulator n=2 Tax=Paracoccus alkenifer TaxID=65735 RepID=A0A1H6K6L0_9RHOB|nr:ArsR family transcriptional regulator [Paracoccus alkenifer]
MNANASATAPEPAAAMRPLIEQTEAIASLFKAMGHDGRLTILCHLRSGEKNVSELEALLSSRQAIVSQQLARLRMEGLVVARREGQTIHYRLADARVAAILDLLARHARVGMLDALDAKESRG